MKKKVVILGSTGSIGCNALEVLDALSSEYEVIALSAHRNIDLLAKQVRRFTPAYAAITHEESAAASKQFDDFSGTILSGPDSLVELASLDQADIIVCAVVGAAGLLAALAAALLFSRQCRQGTRKRCEK